MTENKEEIQILKCCTTWDMFDTLQARSCIEPINVFNKIGTTIPNFTNMRRKAENNMYIKLNGSNLINSTLPWNTIYTELQALYNWTDEERDRVQQLELDEERKVAIPIQSNIDKVKDGDIIISDMYLPANILLSILREQCGLTANVTVYSSVNGKSSGWIYDKIRQLEQCDIKLHVGDNIYSDIKMAKNAGIKNSHHCQLNLPNHYEQKININFARLMRSVRLMCPYSNNPKKNKNLGRFY